MQGVLNSWGVTYTCSVQNYFEKWLILNPWSSTGGWKALVTKPARASSPVQGLGFPWSPKHARYTGAGKVGHSMNLAARLRHELGSWKSQHPISHHLAYSGQFLTWLSLDILTVILMRTNTILYLSQKAKKWSTAILLDLTARVKGSQAQKLLVRALESAYRALSLSFGP